jgi:hypothetical protein
MLTIVMMCPYFVVILSVVMLNVVVPLKSLMSETKLGTDPTNNFTSVTCSRDDSTRLYTLVCILGLELR